MDIDKKIKKVVLREDFMAITDDCKEAIVLNQFLYWAERVKDADKIIEEENEIARRFGETGREPLYGWIYKTAEDMAEETLLGMSKRTVGRYMDALVNKGFIDRRHNPKFKWDRTYQYRFNFINVALALREKGYVFSDYKNLIIPESLTNRINSQKTKTTLQKDNMTNQKSENVAAIPYTTTDIININYDKIEYNRCIPKRNGTFDFSIVENQIDTVCRRDKRFNSECVKEIFRYYYKQYYRWFGKHHPKITNKNLKDIFDRIYESTYFDCFTLDGFREMIDRHFARDYGIDIDYNINHFMTPGILDLLCSEIAS